MSERGTTEPPSARDQRRAAHERAKRAARERLRALKRRKAREQQAGGEVTPASAAQSAAPPAL